MNVLIVARTRMAGDRVCVGGIDVTTGTSIRLLGSDGQNLLESNPIRPGEIWSLTYRPRSKVTPPHVEDVIVAHGHKVETVPDMRAAILGFVSPWHGPIETIFDGRLSTTDAATAFLARDQAVPCQSTGFWIGSVDIRQSKFDPTGRRYWIPDAARIRKLKYVGMDGPIAVIPAGTLVRLSLARWKAFPPGVEDERCYLQLSGWYL